MKKTMFFILAVIFIFSICSISIAGTKVRIYWSPNTESDLAGYKVYQRVGNENYDFDNPIATIPAGTEECIIENLPDGDYHWVVTAYDLAGNESEPSNEVGGAYDSAPGCVQGVGVEIVE